jgi:thymidylate synthase ThyX
MEFETKKSTVTLLSWTQNPLETVYAEWQQSRTTGPIDLPATLAQMVKAEQCLGAENNGTAAVEAGPIQKQIEEVAEKVISMKMPLGETIELVFLLEHIPIALREQHVRHRIGHGFGDKIGADIIPDLAGGSSFWSQSIRILDMGKFADEGEFFMPESVMNSEKEVDILLSDGTVLVIALKDFYFECMKQVQQMYGSLVGAGIPLEDARNVLPMAMQHRYTWKTNLSALMHMMSKRGCWFSQLGMWEPVINGIVNELSEKIHPMFRKIIDPPCFGADGNYHKCTFVQENEDKSKGGEFPPCSLWLWKEKCADEEGALDMNMYADIIGDRRPRYSKMQDKFAKLWGRDPRSGERKVLA